MARHTHTQNNCHVLGSSFAPISTPPLLQPAFSPTVSLNEPHTSKDLLTSGWVPPVESPAEGGRWDWFPSVLLILSLQLGWRSLGLFFSDPLPSHTLLGLGGDTLLIGPKSMCLGVSPEPSLHLQVVSLLNLLCFMQSWVFPLFLCRDSEG
jgi:hypothetical protein